MKVGYLGPEGTFSEEAAVRYFHGENIEAVPFRSIAELLEDTQAGVVERAIVPIENTIEGSIHLTVDTLADATDLFVEGELVLPVSQHLLALPGARIDMLREVWSIAPAIAQCRRFLRNLDVTVREYGSTAAAAKAVRDSGRSDVAAIASAFAAQRFGLVVLAAHIQDVRTNHTRFVVIRRGPEPSPRARKTMLLIVPCQEHTGVLANILHVFASLGLNLTWIVSRPTRERLGTYQFFLDVEAAVTDDAVKKALAILDILGHSVRVLGSYETREPLTPSDTDKP
ncbi:MAG: prephenate dehydratase [Thermoflavifilum sp.]|nr:prephenate dehydratase [Thermoflavifilum sp.]MCL6512799.1 prephenate dehydratase [Alicyclobacillus sp.]